MRIKYHPKDGKYSGKKRLHLSSFIWWYAPNIKKVRPRDPEIYLCLPFIGGISIHL